MSSSSESSTHEASLAWAQQIPWFLAALMIGVAVVIVGLFGAEANATAMVAKILGNGCLLLLAPFLLGRQATSREFCTQVAGGTLLLCGVLVVLGWSSDWLELEATGWVTAGLGFASGFAALVRCRAAGRSLLWAVLAGLMLVPYVLNGSQQSSRPYQHPLLATPLGIEAYHLDTLFHVSISQMIRTHEVPSTGVEGVPYQPYHFGSHWLMARLFGLLRTDAAVGYLWVYPLLVFPLFCQALLLLAARITDWLPAPFHKPSSSSSPWLWALLLVAITGCYPTPVRSAVCIWELPIPSESYTWSIALLFLGLVVASPALKRLVEPESGHAAADLARLAVLCTLLPLVGFVKVSTMAVAGGVLGCFFLRSRGWRNPAFFLMLVLSAVACYFVLQQVKPLNTAEQTSSLSPLRFFRTCVPTEYWLLYLPLNGAPIWVLAAIGFACACRPTWSELKTALVSGRLILLEMLLLAAAVGYAPSLLGIATESGACVNFSDPVRWLAFAGLLAVVPPLLARPATAAASGWGRLLGAFAVLVLTLQAAYTLQLSARSFLAQSRSMLAAGGVDKRLEAPSLDRKELGQALKQLRFLDALSLIRDQHQRLNAWEKERRPVVTLLRQLAELPLEDKRRTTLYIPKRVTQLWQAFDDPDDHPYALRRSLLAPALTGICLFDGLPNEALRNYAYYGNVQFKDQYGWRQQLPWPEERAEVMRLARERGFQKLAVIDLDGQGQPRLFFEELGP